MSSKADPQAVDLALRAGQLMLESGGETYRVEETIERICIAAGMTDVHIFCVPTGMFMSARAGNVHISRVVRPRGLTIDLENIDLLNKFSREYSMGAMDSNTAILRLKQIEQAPRFGKLTRALFGGIAAGFFALLGGGVWTELLGAGLVGTIVIALLDQASRLVRSYFIRHLLGGVLVAGLSLLVTFLFHTLGLQADPDLIIVGGLMPLVPGVAITNALRDILSGDYVSGISRLSEAIFIAIGMALGTGLVLSAVTL